MFGELETISNAEIVIEPPCFFQAQFFEVSVCINRVSFSRNEFSASAAPNPEIKISVPVGGEQFEEQAAIFVCDEIITRPCAPVVGIDIVNSETGLLRVPFFYVGFSGLLKPVF